MEPFLCVELRTQNLPGKYPAKECADGNDDEASNPELHLRAGLNP
jgi:hypothetical protein